MLFCSRFQSTDSLKKHVYPYFPNCSKAGRFEFRIFVRQENKSQ